MKQVLKDHFVPHHGNDYRPHVLQRAAMSAMLGLVLVSFAMANLQALLWLNVDWLVSAVLPAIVVEETNEERADGAIAPLQRNATLDRAAQLKAEHMAELGYFAHYAPDGTSPWHWFRSTNYTFAHAGENLAVHFNDSREVVRAWMNSPTHRANIMNGNFAEIGIGVAEGQFEGYNTVFVVQMFGTPAQTAPVATSETETETVTVVTEQVQEPTNSGAALVAAAEETVTDAPVGPAAATPEPDTPTAPPATYTLPDTSVAPTPAEAASTTPTTSLAAAPTPIAEQFISTTTNAVPAQIEPVATAGGTVSTVGRLATSPQLVLQVLYSVLALFVVVALSLALVIEFRRHQLVQVAYSVSLLVVMGGLFYLQTIVTTGATIM